MSDEERLQNLVAELRVLESYWNEISQREALLTQAALETRAALEALQSLPNDGTAEVLVPIGGGLFIRTDAKAPERLVVNIGAEVAVEKSRGDAQNFLETRQREVEEALGQLAAQKSDLATKINAARSAMNALVAKLQKAQ